VIRRVHWRQSESHGNIRYKNYTSRARKFDGHSNASIDFIISAILKSKWCRFQYNEMTMKSRPDWIIFVPMNLNRFCFVHNESSIFESLWHVTLRSFILCPPLSLINEAFYYCNWFKFASWTLQIHRKLSKVDWCSFLISGTGKYDLSFEFINNGLMTWLLNLIPWIIDF